MFEEFRQEWAIRRTLKLLARQRVAVVLQPENVWVVEKAINDNENTDADLATCHMRGWIEPLTDAIPTGQVPPDGKLPANFKFDKAQAHYKLTSAGWSVLYRSYQLSILAVVISISSVLISVIKH